jgi:ribonuclease P protein component
MRTGQKAVGKSVVLYLKQNDESTAAKFGFVVAKTVGSAVQRNLVKRRLRSAIRDRMKNFKPGQTLVIRALPSSSQVTWESLTADLDSCLTHVSK